MKDFVTYDKLSKNEQKKINIAKRRTWKDYGCQSPVTKVVKDKKKQEKKNMCREHIREF